MKHLPVSRWLNLRIGPILIFSGLYLLFSFLLRLVLWNCFGREAGVDFLQLTGILPTGAANDLVELFYLLLPLTLYLLVLPGRWAQSRGQLLLFGIVSYLMFFGLLYLGAVEYFFFDEFDSRFNLVAVDYLIYPHEVLVNIWESYPVLWFLAVDACLSALLLRWTWPLLRRWVDHPAGVSERVRTALLHGLLLAAAIAGFRTDTLAWSQNRVANELAANGISSLFQAFHTNQLDYLAYYRTMPDSRAFETLRRQLSGHGGAFRSPKVEDLNRSFEGTLAGLGKMNVVVVVEESFGADFVDACGAGLGLTPSFDGMARQGILFRNAFATGTRTVRGLEAITCSFPPIPSESIIKRPGSEDIANWGSVMHRLGYHTSFLYGGYGYFDRMNPFFAGNGFAIQDRSDIPDPAFTNIWGVSDEDLFGHALRYYDQVAREGHPFFSLIMTTSNHKPYTFPAGIPGIPPQGGGRKAGIRYADYALGRFLSRAQEHPWFDRTLFVIVADHDARVYGRAEVPVKHYRIPLLIYAPKQVKPQVVETPTSQIDIAPTVLGLLGLPYTAPFFGEDVLNTGVGDRHPVLLNHNHDVALLQGTDLLVLGLNRRVLAYRYDPAHDSQQPETPDPALVDLATAYYQTAYDLFQAHHYQ